MNLVLEAIPVPLREDGHGGLRVGHTRVSFESVWHMHLEGASPAEIALAFDTLDPADAYTVLAWALRHPEDVAAYLERRDQEASEIKHELQEANLSPAAQESAKLKDKLSTRRQDSQRQRGGDAGRSDR